ncbi:MAG: hypothetical protein CL569_07050 [Alphaproteobacteria bacterium]|nr:hypothetical protein [Alphaproteobacteria bacterium]|tara:strand:+ start:3666 stop:4637 length:972 start_codon:yes stop_codon:yes gene_type:complete
MEGLSAPNDTASSQSRIFLALEEVLVLGALAALVALGLASKAPIFEPLYQSRLTFMTVVALCGYFAWEIYRHSTRRFFRFLRDWIPVVGLLGVYESLKHMHANRITVWLGIEPMDPLMIRLDEALFGKVLPLWIDHWDAEWFIGLMWFFYIEVYYLGPALILLYLYASAKRMAGFMRLRRGMVFGFLGGYVLYLLIPVAGPLYYMGEQFTHPIGTQPIIERHVFDLLRYNWDAFPSLHTAIPWLLTILAWRYLPRWARYTCVIASAGVTLSTVALRYHYGIDLVAAVLWTGAVYLIVIWMEKRNWNPGIALRSPWQRENHIQP